MTHKHIKPIHLKEQLVTLRYRELVTFSNRKSLMLPVADNEVQYSDPHPTQAHILR